jgi:hypothetical protein
LRGFHLAVLGNYNWGFSLHQASNGRTMGWMEDPTVYINRNISNYIDVHYT